MALIHPSFTWYQAWLLSSVSLLTHKVSRCISVFRRVLQPLSGDSEKHELGIVTWYFLAADRDLYPYCRNQTNFRIEIQVFRGRGIFNFNKLTYFYLICAIFLLENPNGGKRNLYSPSKFLERNWGVSFKSFFSLINPSKKLYSIYCFKTEMSLRL